MSGAANQGVFGQGPSWLQDERAFALWAISRPLLIAGAILGFFIWWPVGLVLLCLAVWNRRVGRMLFGCEPGGFRRHACAGWGGGPGGARGWRGGFSRGPGRSSGNQAFDEYKADTLRRLEEEQAEFSSFLERLRFAKDKAEFDQFMAERRAKPPAPPEGEERPQA